MQQDRISIPILRAAVTAIKNIARLRPSFLIMSPAAKARLRTLMKPEIITLNLGLRLELCRSAEIQKPVKKKKAPIGPQRIATDKIFNSHCITIIVKYH